LIGNQPVSQSRRMSRLFEVPAQMAQPVTGRPDLILRRARQMLCYLGHRVPGRDRAIVRRYLAESRIKKLHIGCGKNVLPGWLNMDALPLIPDVLYLDATRRFSFKDAAFDFIFSEHMIEHISYHHGLNMLAECQRVLKPSGKIRISTPDLNFLVNLYRDESELHQRYVKWSAQAFINGTVPEDNAVLVINHFVRNWGHRFIYDEKTLREAMLNAGFTNLVKCDLQDSEDPVLCNLENEARLPLAFLRLETLTLEGTKPA
jgi:predicted SAM-dependent methyltransferase